MGWITTTTPTWVLQSQRRYKEWVTVSVSVGDTTISITKKYRWRRVQQWRTNGLTQESAVLVAQNEEEADASVLCTVEQANQAGAYSVTKTKDEVVGDWVVGDGGEEE